MGTASTATVLGRLAARNYLTSARHTKGRGRRDHGFARRVGDADFAYWFGSRAAFARAGRWLTAGQALAAAPARRGSVVSDPVTRRTARQRLLAHLAPVEHPPQILGVAGAREPRCVRELGLRDTRSLTHERKNLSRLASRSADELERRPEPARRAPPRRA